MKSKLKWSFYTTLAVFMLSISVLFGVLFLHKEGNALFHANAAVKTSNQVQEQYVVGDKISFSDCFLEHNGKDYPATVYVTYPSGKRVVGNEANLDEIGTYTILYKYVSESLYLEESKEFFVSKKLFEVDSPKSTAVYADFPSSYSDKGIIVSLANGDTFKYNRIIDLSKVSTSDKILQFFHNPNTPGSVDASRVEFILTDIYDPTNYVTIIAKVHAGDGMYMTVNAAHQPATGATPCKEDTVSSLQKVFWRNQWYIMQSANRYGTWYGYAFNGVPSSGREIGSECLEFSTDGTAFFGGSNNKLLADLGDKEQFTDIWTGFTTGEVYLTIKGSGYEKSTMNFVIPTILDHDLSSLGMQDTKAPTIDVLWDSDIPEAIVGQAYKIFDTKTTDDYTENVKCSAKVYYNYYSSTKSLVQLQDGMFIPKNSGTYTIEYTAKDAANNVTIKKMDVLARTDISPLSIALSNYDSEYAVGDKIVVATPSIQSHYDKNSIKVEAILKGTETVYLVNDTDLTFVPFYDGTYIIRYTVSNYVETLVKEYEITVDETDKQYIFDNVNLPKYFIKNAEYKLPSLVFYDFGMGDPQEKITDIFVKEDGATEKKIESDVYKVNANNSVEVIYYTADKGDQVSYTVPVVDVGFGVRLGLQMDKYFVSDTVKATKTNDYMAFTAKESGTLRTEFVNKLYADEVVISFALLRAINQYNALNFYLTDVENPNITVKLSYQWKDEQILFSINDEKTTVIDSKLGNECSLEFELEHENKCVSQFSGVTTKINTTLNGAKFEGFTSKYVYVSFELEDASAGAGFNLYKINNQLFHNAKLDGIDPRIYAESVRGYKEVDREVTIKAAAAIDVLSPFVKFTIRITDPNGQIVTDVLGNRLDETADVSVDHVIKLEKAGKYTISYSAVDASDNSTPYNFVITVTDIIPPSITLSNMITEAEVGKTVKLATVTYDKADIEKMYVVVIAPDSSVSFIEENKLKVTQTGVYRISYYATDFAGNVAIESYSLTVR